MSDKDDLPKCRYGVECYRKNPDHLKKFSHPPPMDEGEHSKGKNEESEESDDDCPVKPKRQKTGADDDSGISKESESENDEDEDKDDEGKQKTKNKDVKNKNSVIASTSSYSDRKNLIKQYCGFDMPDDFYALWDVAVSMTKIYNHDDFVADPREAFIEFGIILCGPFDIMAGKFGDATADDFLLHGRYYYDVPEFQTVIKFENSKEDLYHIGYLRDEPGDNPIVCSNNGKDCKLTIMGDNLFAALKKNIDEYWESLPFRGDDAHMDYENYTEAITAGAKKHNFTLEINSQKVKDRKKKTVAKTFHGAGIVVPMNGDVGYRPLGTKDDVLKKILKHISGDDEKMKAKASAELQDMITYIQFANDEGDFGMGYELGIDLFCSGYTNLHPYVDQLLSVAYKLLKREPYKMILDAHLAKRQRGKAFFAA